jgi:hypothetical protein
MTADTIRKLDMLKRVNRFIVEHSTTSTVPRAAAAHAEVVTIITALEAAARDQATGLGESEGGVDLRVTTARELREYLKDVNRTARALETDHPGISPTFRLPKSGSYPALIARARAIIEAATPIQASFVDAGLPPTFLAELQSLLTAFENATSQKHDGRIARVLGTATLKAKANLGVNAATNLDACVRNHFRGNPEMLAAWAHARRIERAPRRSSGNQPITQGQSQPGSPNSNHETKAQSFALTELPPAPDEASDTNPSPLTVLPATLPANIAPQIESHDAPAQVRDARAGFCIRKFQGFQKQSGCVPDPFLHTIPDQTSSC